MYITIIGFILILFFTPLGCFERRRSFDSTEAGRSPSPMPAPDFKKPETVHKEFDFYGHWFKKHTKLISNDVRVILPDKPVEYLFDHNYETLHEAALANDEKGIEKLLRSEYHKEHLNAFNNDGQTALQCAIDYGCDNAIACLIKYGARVDFQNRDGEYDAWTLAKLYAESTVCMNVIPLMALQQALAQKGELDKYSCQKKKKRVEEKKVAQEKPRKIIRLKRRAGPMPVPAPEPEEGEYDPYLLNV